MVTIGETFRTSPVTFNESPEVETCLTLAVTKPRATPSQQELFSGALNHGSHLLSPKLLRFKFKNQLRAWLEYRPQKDPTNIKCAMSREVQEHGEEVISPSPP